jgi:uncharacterized RDD family membrane protein YckC
MAATSGPPPPPEYTRDDLAGWWIRVGAYVIDLVVLLVALLVLARVGAAVNHVVGVILVLLWAVAAGLGYWVWFEGGESGQTIGKRAVGIRVRNEHGGPAGYGHAFARNLVGRMIGLVPLVGLIDVLWPLWDDRRQCLHDKAGGTLVVDD